MSSDQMQRAAMKRVVIRAAMYELRQTFNPYDGRLDPAFPEDDFNDLLAIINITIAKLDAIDDHPSGQPDLAAIDRHLRAVD